MIGGIKVTEYENKNEKSLILCAFIFIILLVSDDSLLFGSNSSSLFQMFKFIIYIFIFISMIIYMSRKKIKIDKNKMMYVLILAALIICTSIVNLDFKFGYIYRICILLFSMLVSNLMSLKKLLWHFNKVIMVTSIFSVIVFIIEVQNKDLFRYFPIIINSAGNSFYNLFFTIVPLDNYGVPRNYGFYREPGVFAIFLIIALVIEIYYFEEKSLPRQLILLVTILTTKSTTGYIVICLVYAGYLVKNSSTIREKRIKVVFFILSLFVLYYILNHTNLIFSENKYYSVFGKYDDIDKSNSRISSIFINIRIFLDQPFFGSGISNVTNLFPVIGFNRYGVSTEHNTNTMLLQLSTYGLLFFTVYTKMVFDFAKNVNKDGKIMYTFLISFILILILSGENLSNNILFTSFLFFISKNKKDGQII